MRSQVFRAHIAPCDSSHRQTRQGEACEQQEAQGRIKPNVLFLRQHVEAR